MNQETCYDLDQGVTGPQPVYENRSNGVVKPEPGEISSGSRALEAD
ncbi:hypothetical protein L0244_37270 [bacterium]|nr:hypothetical protein [bacterium]